MSGPYDEVAQGNDVTLQELISRVESLSTDSENSSQSGSPPEKINKIDQSSAVLDTSNGVKKETLEEDAKVPSVSSQAQISLESKEIKEENVQIGSDLTNVKAPVLQIEEISQYYEKAKAYIDTHSVSLHTFEFLHRWKTSEYFEKFKLKEAKIMPCQLKDDTGHSGNPIIGTLKGIWFIANKNYNGTEKEVSPYEEHNIYFSDFYCKTSWKVIKNGEKKNFVKKDDDEREHYVVLVVTKKNSSADKYILI
uniref:Phytanoyl-CoA hydroxylase-interacting protein-like C-terminal domain-containing protein n=1 Tax=Acrobeloides nanus TaxID=290746 RepID=A0A914C799_9BILA